MKFIDDKTDRKWIQVGSKMLYDGQIVSGSISGIKFEHGAIYIPDPVDTEHYHPSENRPFCFYVYQNVQGGREPILGNPQAQKEYKHTWITSWNVKKRYFHEGVELDGYSKKETSNDSIGVIVNTEPFSTVSSTEFKAANKIKPQFDITDKI